MEDLCEQNNVCVYKHILLVFNRLWITNIQLISMRWDCVCVSGHMCVRWWINTLQVVNMSEMALRLRLAVDITSSCWAELPAATALAVATVMPLVMRMNSSGVVDFSGTSLDWKTLKTDDAIVGQRKKYFKHIYFSLLNLTFLESVTWPGPVFCALIQPWWSFDKKMTKPEDKIAFLYRYLSLSHSVW